MSVTGDAFSMIDDIDSEGTAAWGIGTDARAQRIVKPDQAVTIDTDA